MYHPHQMIPFEALRLLGHRIRMLEYAPGLCVEICTVPVNLKYKFEKNKNNLLYIDLETTCKRCSVVLVYDKYMHPIILAAVSDFISYLVVLNLTLQISL